LNCFNYQVASFFILFFLLHPNDDSEMYAYLKKKSRLGSVFFAFYFSSVKAPICSSN
jgi:hypothetical protein